MGLYPPEFVTKLKRAGITWFANISTVAEARAAEDAGADVVVAQGMEAGGHRGCFEAAEAERQQVGLFALLPAVVDAVKIPVVATGGIADGRGVAAALLLGASAAQIGTGLLRCPEAKLHPAWADALSRAAPEDTMVSRVFSGRAGRSIATDYVRAATARMRRRRRHIRCSAALTARCAAKRRKRATPAACRSGPDNRPAWRGRSPPAKWSGKSGTARALCLVGRLKRARRRRDCGTGSGSSRAAAGPGSSSSRPALPGERSRNTVPARPPQKNSPGVPGVGAMPTSRRTANPSPKPCPGCSRRWGCRCGRSGPR